MRKFFEVFQNLKLDDDVIDLFKDVMVPKVTANRDHTKMRVYIESNRLIEKSVIYDVKKAIENSLKTGKRISVEIIEKYHLSSQYTREYLLEEYKESLALEIGQKSHSLGVFFAKAPMFFDEDTLEISFYKTIVSESLIEDMKKVLMDIFENRFNMPIKVKVVLKESQEKRFEEQNRKKLENVVQAIMKNNQKKEKKKTELDEDGNEVVVKKTTEAAAEDVDGVVYGKDFDEEDEKNKRLVSELKDIYEGTGRVICKGEIFSIDSNETKTGKFIIKMNITDYTDSITVKIFLPNEEVKNNFLSVVKNGTCISVLGSALYDDFDGEVEVSHVGGIKIIDEIEQEKREDTAVEKRVELHCHTKMSDMDAVADPEEIVQRAYDWGHKAVAITDHGVVLGFPDANKRFNKIKAKCEKQGQECDFKVIYGVEAYLVDDIKGMIVNPKGQDFDAEYVVFDLETTGFSSLSDRIIEIGAIKLKNGEIVDRFSTFVNPEVPIPHKIEDLTGISDSMVIDAPKIDEVLPKFMDFVKDSILVAHNADFDVDFISALCKERDIPCEFTVVDTLELSRFLLTGLGKHQLQNVAKALGVPLSNHHRAVDDAECTANIFLKLCNMMKDKGITNLDMANEVGMKSQDLKNKSMSYHAVILVKNLVGLKNLYKLISISHIETFARKQPRIMKSDYLKHKEGLIIGSACEKGELYQAILNNRPDQDIVRIADFYDYLEIQPLGNNEFLLKTGDSEIDDKKKHVLLDSKKDLEEINKKIVAIGRKLNKMTVATCDVHFLDPEDEIYRRIIQKGNGFSDADNQPPIYLRTTEEMLKEFEYLGMDLAEEVVITNTNKIADMIETISPIHPDKCPPVLENSEENLKKMCYEKAHDMYGEELPNIVKERLDTELNSIIGNGYAVMYIMAQKLVAKSIEDGYLVGSRGSVGSSFAATMSSITECNPLPPHYYCEHCKTSVFEDEYSSPGDVDEEKLKALQGNIIQVRRDNGVGFDLPDAFCPHCGEKMKKDGLEIPFETFLGFGGNKEPDIDLNFSGDYQARAHAYTEEMFGKGNTFRAGTISGLADKNAFGYVKHYFEDRNEQKRKAEIERIKGKLIGVRKTTGQHPGGIVIVPRDKEIYDFTPIQKPANDMNADTITTHFEYHAIDGNLLKLDELGHDDPTMIRRLEKLTDTNVREDVPFDDPKVMSLFQSPKALGITSKDIDGCPTGSLGLPELGTDFVIQMIVDTKPTKFADLVRLAGLSHGTNVWLGNAQVLIKEGKCNISSAICTRDDIMVYLMEQGIDPLVSFEIMEHVRKGKGLLVYYNKDDEEIDEEKIMKEAGVPDWYIWSCKKISYMFPKAHAAAYIMMALRVAWYKVYYPLAYYTAFFSIRAKQFDYETMCQGPQKLHYEYEQVKNRIDNHTSLPKDDASYSDMRIVQEMYARGFEFMPLDIYKAKAHEFQIIDGKIMPALDSIDGMGDKVAEKMEEVIAQMDGPFESKKEMAEKCGINKTVLETMTKLGLLKGMREDSQLSFFDL